MVHGVAESVLRDIDPELLERVRGRAAEVKISEPLKQRQQKRAKNRDQGMEL